MARVYWGDEADEAFKLLPPAAQQAIQDRLRLLERFPELYPVAQTGRYRGYRHFVVRRRYVVYYKVMGNEQGCFIRDIQPARGRPE